MSVQEKLFNSGLVGLIVSILAGVGSFLIHYSPEANFGGDYNYFSSITDIKIIIGHYLSILIIPLYLIGYWHFGQVFISAGNHKCGWIIMLGGTYAMVIGLGWIAGRMGLGFTAKEMSPINPPDLNLVLDLLLFNLSMHNEPLIYISLLILFLIACLWFWQIIKDKTIYPRWMAFFSPFVLYVLILLIYVFIPDAGRWLYPAAIHIAHAVVFALSLYYLKKNLLV
jgi:hypothetical protein